MKCIQCGLCCQNTEMLLSSRDIARLEALGYDRKEFAVTTPDGFHQLRNIEGRCFFFKEGKCIIYPSRPEGCVLYPVILDIDGKNCITDKECPNHNTVTEEEMKDNCKKLRKLYKEIIKEIVED
ncbi:MAG: YkgJ family cysteine cluster protein [Candidatus Jordarchaeaceae archaeon]